MYNNNNNPFQIMFDLVNNSTFINNVNKGITVPPDYFGSKTTEGMAYSKGSLYNKHNTMVADMTKPQSNYMNLNGVK